MAAIAHPGLNGFSVVTLFDREPGGWHAHLPNAPALGCSAKTRSERNLLGTRLDQAVIGADRAVLLLAEGAGCLAAAWWARLSPSTYVSKVKGALFIRPDAEAAASFASPAIRLPFPSVVVDEPGQLSPGLHALVESWGSGVDADAGPGTLFARTQRAIERFTAGIVERDVQTARGLIGRR